MVSSSSSSSSLLLSILKNNIYEMFLRVSIAVNRHHDHGNSYKEVLTGAGLQVHRVSLLSPWQEEWWHSSRHGVGEALRVPHRAWQAAGRASGTRPLLSCQISESVYMKTWTYIIDIVRKEYKHFSKPNIFVIHGGSYL